LCTEESLTALSKETLIKAPRPGMRYACWRVIGLEDVIAESLEDASQLGKRFETEAGLFCDVYDWATAAR